MRRLALLVAAALVVPVFTASPAFAVDNVICVNTADPSCTPGQAAATISDAIAQAGSNSLDDTILVGPGTYTDGPYQLNAGVHALTLKGAGQATVLAPPGTPGLEIFVTANHASVQSLRIEMPPSTVNDVGLLVNNSGTADGVTIDGTGTSNTTGLRLGSATVTNSSVQMPLGSGTRGVFASGNSTILDTTIRAAQGFDHSGVGTTDTLSRVRIQAVTEGIVTDSGDVTVDDALIDLGSGAGTGLAAANLNASPAPKAINANHVTIVGGGAGSKGAWANAANPTALQVSTIVLDNSIVRGPATDLVATAGNLVGPSSIATITASYSDWSTFQENATANGVADVVSGLGNLDVNPLFVDAASGNYRLGVGSPVVDKGNPAAGGPATDLDGTARVVDGDGDGIPVRDMGAYEWHDSVAPETTIIGGPTGATSDATPTFSFTSEAGATFECKVDGGAFTTCTSPFTTPSLSDGAHAFSVRATDAAANTDATPAARSFTVDTTAPQTTITKKPAKRTTKRKVKFGFIASEAGVSFECKLDNRAYRPCTSPKKYRVKLGKHVFSVGATDALGHLDATPAHYRFKRIAKGS